MSQVYKAVRGADGVGWLVVRFDLARFKHEPPALPGHLTCAEAVSLALKCNAAANAL